MRKILTTAALCLIMAFGCFGQLTVHAEETAGGVKAADKADADSFTGWKKADGYWYYYENGEPYHGWLKNGGYWYYLDTDGRMYSDGSEWIDNDCYRFDGSGHMVTGWYTEYEGTRYYYFNNGKAANGLTEIDGVQYYFNANGSMLHDTMTHDAKNHRYIRIGENGIVTHIYTIKENGWSKVEDDWYYYENGEPYQGWLKSNGFWYYLDSGHMYRNLAPGIYNEAADQYEYYRFDENGHMVIGWYVDEWKDKYYYSGSGKAVNGLREIDGILYYFEYAGRMLRDTMIEDIESHRFIKIDESGAVKGVYTIKENGWFKAGNDWYYYQDWQPYQGWLKNGRYWFYLDTDGRMFSDVRIWIEDSYYCFDENGHMVTGWYDDGWDRFYYLASGKAAQGLKEIDGVLYYFSDGYLYTGQRMNLGATVIEIRDDGAVTSMIKADIEGGWKQISGDWYYAVPGYRMFITDALRQIDGRTYGFDYRGVMLTDTIANIGGYNYGFDHNGYMVRGWFQSRDGLGYYYFDDQGHGVNGFTTIDDVQYYFIEGRMLQSKKWVSGDTLFIIDASGKVTEYTGADGWVANTYYVENGRITEDTWKEINGKWYYFNREGISYKDGRFGIGSDYYYFDSSGVMLTGWIKNNDSWYYSKANGKLYTDSWLQSGSVWYYFDAYSRSVSDIVSISGKTYLFNSDYTYSQEITGSGKWVKNDKYWYYIMSDGSYVRDDTLQIHGITYCFDYRGRMAVDTGYYYEGKQQYAGADGKPVLSKWINDNERWTYYDEKGIKAADGWKEIGSDWYYFNPNGYMVIGDAIIDNSLYHFLDSGVWDGKAGTALKTGWNLIKGNYYYYDGNAFSTGFKTIDGKTYYFFSNGAMFSGGLGYYSSILYVFDNTGALVRNGWWKNENGYWFYADSDGICAEGFRTIGGRKYYFDPWMYTEGVLEDDTYYDIADNGTVIAEIKQNGAGWQKTSKGEYLYSRDGGFVNGYQNINGDYYYFIDGIMMTDFLSPGFGYFGSDGKLSAAEGWVQTDSGDWYYLVNGQRLSGSRLINRKWYFFDNRYSSNGAASDGIFFVDGAFYKYNGAAGGRTRLNFTEGWNQYNGEKYYVLNGDLVRNRVYKIGARYYYFAMDGRMYDTDVVVDFNGTRYLKSDHTFLKDAWKKIDGTWYYFGPEGTALTGTWKIDGKTYRLTDPFAVNY